MDKDTLIGIGGRIRSAREAAGLTQEKLADLIDVSVQFISDLERGKSGLSVETLIKTCSVLQVSSDYILFEKLDKNIRYDFLMRLEGLSPDALVLMERQVNLMVDALRFKG